MSWHAWIEFDPDICSSCGQSREIDLGNYTHNCNKMMRLALNEVGHLEELGERDLYALDGESCLEWGPKLVEAIDWWSANYKEVAVLNPVNGRGDCHSAFVWWRDLAMQCHSNPDGILRMLG